MLIFNLVSSVEKSEWKKIPLVLGCCQKLGPKSWKLSFILDRTGPNIDRWSMIIAWIRNHLIFSRTFPRNKVSYKTLPMFSKNIVSDIHTLPALLLWLEIQVTRYFRFIEHKTKSILSKNNFKIWEVSKNVCKFLFRQSQKMIWSKWKNVRHRLKTEKYQIF